LVRTAVDCRPEFRSIRPERYEHPTTAYTRVDPAWLQARKREDPLKYDREYLCRFGNPEDSLFSAEMLDAMVRTDFEPLSWPNQPKVRRGKQVLESLH